MQDVFRTIARVVPTTLTVMILGESGTGKELVARAVHDLGPRAGAPFVAVNMAAIPRELIEAELFGHERGAFTGAAARASGRFEQAEAGTLFLDEIGDMPLDAQTRLLRVLQSGEFTAVGGARVQRADVRIIAATNQDLRRLIDAGRFREDLYYRLNVVPLRLPPLRARADDIPALARHFLDRAAAEGLPRKVLDAGATGAIVAHGWPGNVRELENLMRRLAALTRGDTIGAEAVLDGLDRVAAPPVLVPAATDLGGAVAGHLAAYLGGFGNDLPPDGWYDRVLAEIERPLLELSLAATGGNQIRAARLLGINRNTLRKKLLDRGWKPGGRSAAPVAPAGGGSRRLVAIVQRVCSFCHAECCSMIVMHAPPARPSRNGAAGRCGGASTAGWRGSIFIHVSSWRSARWSSRSAWQVTRS